MKVLHVNDIANITTVITREAQRRGLEWTFLDIARIPPTRNAIEYTCRKLAMAPSWEMRFFQAARSADLLHVHGATVLQHIGWLRKPFFLHLHGSDIRVAQYSKKYGTIVRRAVMNAERVYYTTPDLRQHVVRLRPDAELFPVTVDLAEVPLAERAHERPRILFASRWDQSKGGKLQIRLAQEIVKLRTEIPEIIFEGLNWGTNARQAAALGIHLHEKMDHGAYLQWLSAGSVMVGQMSGVMGVSEVEAIATEVPLVMALNEQWYCGNDPSLNHIPVMPGKINTGQDYSKVVVRAVKTAIGGYRDPHARTWVQRNHGVEGAVGRLEKAYAEWNLR